MSKSFNITVGALVAGTIIGAGMVLGISSATAGPAAPYVAPECQQAVQISHDYNATTDQTERATLYDAYLVRSKVCLSYPRP
ncbi:hypothetical protein [Pedococcus bigeumensis]|uniref:Uncharacterized protein n=1 Tax=Pedococcus bigeumensis TaxID=433644 RepID=A0A502CHB3_9MICO|nr:hypothetical protein [Pedococcus bigeumensis]TPG12567.1 hypothetical protein EAH86_19880 [Pedococcus bigeumensis]